MLQNINKWIKDAQQQKYAIPQFNINNLEWTKNILEACEEVKSPVILGVSEGAAKYMGGFLVVSKMVSAMIETLKITVPVFLHLDHGSSVENCNEALKAGFTTIMFDGSNLPIDENVKKTLEVVELAKKFDASVEAEVGTVGGNEDGVVGGIKYASFDECMKISKTGITMLAASLGSVHGHYSGLPKLGFDEMKKYSSETKLPLVLHGGSGIPDDMIKRAIENGECKINVNTEIQESFTQGVKEYFEKNLDEKSNGYDPRKVLAQGCLNIKKVVREKTLLFGSQNRVK